MLDYQGANDLFNPQGLDPIALGNLLATDPEAAIPHLVAAGLPPPSGGTQVASAAPGIGLQGLIDASKAPPSPISQIPGSTISGTPGEIPAGAKAIQAPVYSPNDAPGFPPGFPSPTLPAMPPPSIGAGGGFTPAALGGGLPSGAAEPPPQLPTEVAPGNPLDIRSNAQKGTVAPGSKEAVSNMLRSLSGLKMPPSPGIQKIDSPRLPTTHPMQPGSPIAALLQQILGQAQQPPAFRLGQAVK